MTTHEFHAVIQKRGRWYVAFVEELPGANTQGRTLAEARRNLREAIRLILLTNRKLAGWQNQEGAIREPIVVRL